MADPSYGFKCQTVIVLGNVWHEASWAECPWFSLLVAFICSRITSWLLVVITMCAHIWTSASWKAGGSNAATLHLLIVTPTKLAVAGGLLMSASFKRQLPRSTERRDLSTFVPCLPAATRTTSVHLAFHTVAAAESLASVPRPSKCHWQEHLTSFVSTKTVALSS